MQWEGCGLLQSTWEPDDGLAAAQHARDRYWKRNSQRELTRPESAEQRETGVAELMAGAVSTVAAASLARRLTGKQSTWSDSQSGSRTNSQIEDSVQLRSEAIIDTSSTETTSATKC